MRRAAALFGKLLFRRRRARESADPAAELQRRLAEAREREEASEELTDAAAEVPIVPVAETGESEIEQPQIVAAPEPEAVEDDLESLRRSVRERARALAEEMRGPNDGD